MTTAALAGTVRPRGAPVPRSALDLLARSDAELVAATLAPTADEQVLHAHLAALRAGAALLQVTGRPVRRPAPRTVWDMVTIAAPGLAEWATYFADNAAARAAIEAGGTGVADAEQAERTVCAAEDFQAAVRALLDGPDAGEQGALGLRAS